MFGQFLITLLVIVVAAIYLRRRARAERESASQRRLPADSAADNPWRGQQTSRQSSAPPPVAANLAPDYRLIFVALLAVALTLAATLYYFSWQDSRATVTVILHRDDSSAPVMYEVRKRDLGERNFTTIDGTRVRVSANERMEIIGL